MRIRLGRALASRFAGGLMRADPFVSFSSFVLWSRGRSRVPAKDPHCPAGRLLFRSLSRLAPLLIMDDFVGKRRDESSQCITSSAARFELSIVSGRDPDVRLNVSLIGCKKGSGTC